MTVITRIIKIEAIDDFTGNGVLIKRGGIPEKIDSVNGFEESNISKQIIASNAVDVDMMAGTSIANGRILLIEAFAEIRVKLDTTLDTGIIVTPPDDANQDVPGKMYIDGNFQHVYITPIGATSDVTIIISIIGA